MTYELEMAIRYGTFEDVLEEAGITPEEIDQLQEED